MLKRSRGAEMAFQINAMFVSDTITKSGGPHVLLFTSLMSNPLSTSPKRRGLFAPHDKTAHLYAISRQIDRFSKFQKKNSDA